MKTIVLEYVQSFHENGSLFLEEYRLNGKLHNEVTAAFRGWYDNGVLAAEQFFLDGKSHNPSAPAYRAWHPNGQLAVEQYWTDGKMVSKVTYPLQPN